MTALRLRSVPPSVVAVVRVALAAVLFLAIVLPILQQAAGDGTLGYDFRAYELGVRRVIAGQPLYDTSASGFGPFGYFFYPPPFLLLVLPLEILAGPNALAIWTVVLVVVTGASIAFLPVPRSTKWWILYLAELSWPVVFAIKLGQVGPVLLLLFVAGWRWMDRPAVLGSAIALGTLIKIQPILLGGWAALTGRLRAVSVLIVVLAVLSLLATIFAGPQAWADDLHILGRLASPTLTPHSVSLARLAFEAGVGESIANWIAILQLVVIAVVALLAIRYASPTASYLSAVVASQLITPVLWDHYALILLLPVAWLMARGRMWAALVPLATSVPLVGLTPPIVYPLAYWVVLLALLAEGVAERSSTTRTTPKDNSAPAGRLRDQANREPSAILDA